MTRVTSKTWTADQINLLFSLIEKGASPARASAALRRSKLAIQNKARQLGRPFEGVRSVKAARLEREAAALRMLDDCDAGRGPRPAHSDSNTGSLR